MATLKDIAKACGVSTATVSYVVNRGPRSVLPATRDKVLRAIQELDYHPNANARGLRGVKTNTFGVVFPHPQQPFENVYFAPVLAGIVDVATERKMATMLFTGWCWDEAEKSAPILCDGRCDGYVLIAPLKRCELAQNLRDRKMPVVVVGTHPENAVFETVDADNARGARLAVQHLIRLGHRRIAIVTGNLRSSSSWERLNAYRQTLQDHGIPVDESLILREGSVTGDGSPGELSALLADESRRPSAVFCVQDDLARRAIVAAKGVGLKVPDDLSLVGFDDIPAAASTAPPLTTVRQPMREIGRRAAEVLCRNIADGSFEPSDHLFDVQLIERASTAPPKAKRGIDLV